MLMEITPLKGNSTEFKSYIIREENRAPVLLLDELTDRTEEFLTICSWCKQVKVNENIWLEVESAIEELGLFDEKALPQLSHGICLPCYENAQK